MDTQAELQSRNPFDDKRSSSSAERHPRARNTLTGTVYLVLAVCGAVATWTYNILWMSHVQRAITFQEFWLVGFQGSALLGSLAADFWIGSLASLIFMVVEGRRLRMRHLWICVVTAIVFAWACGLPLFLYLRERALRLTPGEKNCR